MKTKIFTFLLVVFFTTTIQAQDLGSLMGQVVKGVKNSGYSNGKSGKNDIINKLNNTKSNDYLGMASIAGEFAGSLKEATFLPGWATEKNGVLDRIQQAGSIADVAGGLSGLVGNLNPNKLTSGFKNNKSTIITALDLLSKMK